MSEAVKQAKATTPRLAYSPVATAVTTRLVFAITTVLALTLRQADTDNTFQIPRITGTRRFAKPSPPRFPLSQRQNLGNAWCLYDYDDVSLMWCRLLSSTLMKYDYKRCNDEPCLFYKITDSVYSLASIVVDDILMASKPASANDELLLNLIKHLKMKDLGTPDFILGMHIARPSTHHITISQFLYIRKLAEKFDLTDSPTHSSNQGHHPA